MLGRLLPGGKGKGNLTKEFTRVRVYRVGRSSANPSLLQVGSSGNAPCRGSVASPGAWSLRTKAHNRWVIERFYQDAELGLDD